MQIKALFFPSGFLVDRVFQQLTSIDGSSSWDILRIDYRVMVGKRIEPADGQVIFQFVLANVDKSCGGMPLPRIGIGECRYNSCQKT